MRAPLHIVDADEPAETVAEKVRRLQSEAKAAASDHVAAMLDMLAAPYAIASEVHGGGDAYAAGARAIARDICLSSESQALILRAITGRKS